METGRVATTTGVELAFSGQLTGSRTVVLLHGWPQTSHAWRKVVPLLQPEYSSLALDLRGIGRSSTASRGFDKATMADDVDAALNSLQIAGPVVLVGHGIGAMVAYAFARRYRARLAGVVLVDTPLPGLPGWREAAESPAAWHVGFHCAGDRGQELAVELVHGRQEAYFRSFISRFAAYPDRITPEDITTYANAYRGRERLTAGFEMFRTLPLDEAENLIQVEPLTVPILTLFGEYSFGTLARIVADGLRMAGALHVTERLLSDCGHWPAEEQPAALAQMIRDFAADVWA